MGETELNFLKHRELGKEEENSCSSFKKKKKEGRKEGRKEGDDGC